MVNFFFNENDVLIYAVLTTINPWGWLYNSRNICRVLKGFYFLIKYIQLVSVNSEWEWRFGGMILRVKNRVLWEKTCLTATLSTPNLTRTSLGFVPGLRGERPATNHMGHGTMGLSWYDLRSYPTICRKGQGKIATISFGIILCRNEMRTECCVTKSLVCADCLLCFFACLFIVSEVANHRSFQCQKVYRHYFGIN